MKTLVSLFALAAACPLAVRAAEKGVSRAEYLDVIETCVSAYTTEHIHAYADRVAEKGLEEHGFPRLTANIGTLLAHDRAAERKDDFRRMMDLCCREFARTNKAGNDFSVKEIVLALLAVEKVHLYPEAVTEGWRAALSALVAKRIYTCQPRLGDKTAHNWVVFAFTSEQLRRFAGLGGDALFIERYLADQMRFFDPNGMYRDPHDPMVYDMVTRLQFAATLHFGYDGPSRAALERQFLASADATLLMQAASGEIPFGGRSQQQLHNETFYAALCEFYAAWFASCGDRARASRYRLAARRAVDSFRAHAARKPLHHIKNRFPLGDMSGASFGCEPYAYFDKYMVTAASWANLAMAFADETIPAAEATGAECAVYATGPAFHQTLLHAGGYTAQVDTRANPQYDATGLGRLVRAGAPTPLCLCVPVSKRPHYRLSVTNATPFAIAPGRRLADGTWRYAYDGALRLVSSAATNGTAHAAFAADGLDWRLGLSSRGLVSTLRGADELALVLPAFVTDGEAVSRVTLSGRALDVAFRGWTCRYETDGQILATPLEYGNRNGILRRYEARGTSALTVRITLTPTP